MRRRFCHLAVTSGALAPHPRRDHQTYYNDLLRASGGNLNNLSVGTQVGLTF